MTIRESITILTEYNKWRRGLPPYDGETPETHRECPYSPTEIGEAIDTLVEWAERVQRKVNEICDWVLSHKSYFKKPYKLIEDFKNYMQNNE